MHKVLGTTVALFTATILFTDKALASDVFVAVAYLIQGVL